MFLRTYDVSSVRERESERAVRGDWFGRGGLFYVDIAQSLAGSRGSSESVPRLA